jgi:peptidoglycan/LPS O-acetylase OafA/YrhL
MTCTGSDRYVPLDLLRAFLVLLVVAHHTALAYHPYAPPQEPLSASSTAWTAFPIVDGRRWPGIEAFVHFNDTFFMSLFFLISGVVTWPSLAQKGASRFLRDRALRLGVPFVVCAALLAPLAYAATYLVTETDPHLGGFTQQWLSLGMWPAGPVWFLWVLLVFSGIATAISTIVPVSSAALGGPVERLSRHPMALFAALVAVSALVYLPLATAFGPGRWIVAGRFWLQISRVLHYAVYYFAGIGLGVCGLGRGLLAPDGALARGWILWVTVAMGAFALAGATQVLLLSSILHGGPGAGLSLLNNSAFVVSCASASFASLALFSRYAHTDDWRLRSLSANSYGIYLLHFVPVTWLQLLLLTVPLPGALKAAAVFNAAVALSWSLSAALRRIRVVATVI